MKITRIREAAAPIASEIRNAFISFSTMTISVVAVETDVVREGKPVVGYGFSSNGRYSQGGILRERFIPRIMASEPKSLIDEANDNLDPFAVWKAFTANEKPGGADLATDLKRIEAVIEVAGRGENVAVDANGRFDLATALSYGKAMHDYGLFWYEEPGDPLDYRLNAVLAEQYPGALATGENLFSAIDCKNLLRYGGLRPDRDWVQLDPALGYGLTEYLRFLDAAKQLGWSRRRFIPHGGHQLALNIAAGLQLGGS